jgi:DNA polymerase-4
MESAIQTREMLRQVALDLIRSAFPPAKDVRLVGVTLSNFRSQSGSEAAELPCRKM